MNTRLLGGLCLIGGLCYTLFGVYHSWKGPGTPVPGSGDFFIEYGLTILWLLGGICGFLGLIFSNGVGRNPIVRFLSLLPCLGLTLQVLVAFYGVATLTYTTFTPVDTVGKSIELVGLLLVGIFAIAAKTLPGWHKFVPLLCALSVPLSAILIGATGGKLLNLPLFLGLAYALLGWVVRNREAELLLAFAV